MSLAKNIRSGFISGLLLLAPVGVTVFVLQILISRIGRPTRDFFFFFIDRQLLDQFWFSTLLDIVSFFIVICMITILGWFSRLLIGRFVVNRFDRLVSNVPLIRNIYLTVKQIIETFSQQKKAVFQHTVLFEYPRHGIWAIGFMTSDSKGEIQTRTSEEVINIFLPTTPNPTSGFLLMLPRKDVHFLDMAIGDAMKVIISGGAVVPRYNPETGETELVPTQTPAMPETETPPTR
jgi:uncharacterized membrane protein